MCRLWHPFRNIFFLAQDPKERLGCHPQTGFADIQGHPFFRNVDWDLVCQCPLPWLSFFAYSDKVVLSLREDFKLKNIKLLIYVVPEL